MESKDRAKFIEKSKVPGQKCGECQLGHIASRRSLGHVTVDQTECPTVEGGVHSAEAWCRHFILRTHLKGHI